MSEFKKTDFEEEMDEDSFEQQPEVEPKVHQEHHAQHASHHSSEHHSNEHGSKTKFPVGWAWVCGVLLVLLVVSIFTSGFNLMSTGSSGGLSKEKAGEKMLQFVNTNLLQGKAVAELKDVKEESGLYRLNLSISGREAEGYITKDGKLFFPQALNLDQPLPAPAEQQAPAEVPKTDKPKVELFVMSHCPYGTQAEKGILPVANLLKDKIDFEIKYVNYAMHGLKEVQEEMNQVCIKKEQSALFGAYLTCFLEDGDGSRCLTKSKVDSEKLKTCVDKLDKEYKIMELYNDKSSWMSGQFPQFNVDATDNQKYGVQGSPTLVINGAQANSERSPAAYLQTICSSFGTQPEECNKTVSTESYQPGFGYEIAKDASGAASCGN